MSLPPVVFTTSSTSCVESEASRAWEIARASWTWAGDRTPARSTTGPFNPGMSWGARTRSAAAAARSVIPRLGCASLGISRAAAGFVVRECSWPCLELHLRRFLRLGPRLEGLARLVPAAERHPAVLADGPVEGRHRAVV